MAVLIVLFGSWLLLRGVGALGFSALATWHDLARMIPSYVPRPTLIVYITGVCEFLGAVGLLIPGLRSLAGICLILLLIGVFTANINAALKGVTLRGKLVTPLWLRTPMQILFIGLIWWGSRP